MTTHDNITAHEFIEFISKTDSKELADGLRIALMKMPRKKQKGVFTRLDRVKVNHTSGFHRGAKGVVEFVEPEGNRNRIWVKRDGASGPAFFWPSELDHEE